MLETVTIDAARAVGMEQEIGSLETGKKADIILVDRWRPHMVPTFMPLWRLVREACGQDVTDVFVDGKPIVVEGQCVTASEEEVLLAAEQEANQMADRAGVRPFMGRPDGFWGESRY
jgi:cytosine/adenosine deaminase-related metal-dependent hydrolase